MMLHSILSIGTCTEQERQEFGVSDRFYDFTKMIAKAFEKHVGPLGNFDHDTKTMMNDAMYNEIVKTANLRYSYLDYDLTKPFKEQAQANLNKMKELMDDVIKFKEARYKEITANLNNSQKAKIDEFFKYMAFLSQGYKK